MTGKRVSNVATSMWTEAFSAFSLLHYVAGIKSKSQTCHKGDKVKLNAAASEDLNAFVDMNMNVLFNLN